MKDSLWIGIRDVRWIANRVTLAAVTRIAN